MARRVAVLAGKSNTVGGCVVRGFLWPHFQVGSRQPMKPVITTTIPLRNAQQFVKETLESVAAQTRRPERVVVLDNCSTDDTPQIVQSFKGLPLEYIRNPRDLGPFGNFNRCMDFAADTEYLQILHGDDLIAPEFYEKMTAQLEDCAGFGLAWCLDERIDEKGNRLS